MVLREPLPLWAGGVGALPEAAVARRTLHSDGGVFVCHVRLLELMQRVAVPGPRSCLPRAL